jgi:UDP-N-acetylglucosamine 2-epimerase (non-hydrolysing)/GDP/UDP-N,N'-diacetylbacillosamine 2-epimerase (hydrolysing)
MAHLHFTAAEPYRQRVIQLGEPPERVFNIGALGVDAIGRLKLLDRDELERELDFVLGPRALLVTYHPATLEDRPPEWAMRGLLEALDAFSHVQIVITKANADTHGRVINRLVDEYAGANRGRVLASTSLGQLRYLSVMRAASAVVGNSSSGIIEAPALRVPTVNIGDRQKGRLRARSVIDCHNDASSIEAAISQALSEPFRAHLASVESPYGHGGATEKLLDVLESVSIDGIVMKRFHDLPP